MRSIIFNKRRLTRDPARGLARSQEIFHTSYTPLEWQVPEERAENVCYCKPTMFGPLLAFLPSFVLLSRAVSRSSQSFIKRISFQEMSG